MNGVKRVNEREIVNKVTEALKIPNHEFRESPSVSHAKADGGN